MLPETLLRIPLVMFSSADPPWLQGKCARINLSQAPFGIVLQSYRRLPVSIFIVKIAALKRVTGKYSKSVSNFKRGKLKL
jgi:hypothetical protein